ncbi:MAG: ribosome maturation factor RimM [Alphaproteobacteria bacterium]|nr:ribosome maturation factor RimM [Alphaproteobacteria bacterium]MBU0794562.1 ribosome maturation factor RimM [Alphaproteobacteria bacterium]MBU0877046.1 ribosome maturation factor RimM [Alphaproteobacteria bacterium]MBU1768472.1 ribosome maturation factor RimM [Alphaproteobacteria bacterium]
MPTDRPVTLAVVIGAHGVTGEVRLKLFSEGPESLKRYKSFEAAGRTLTLKTVRDGPNGAVARFAEVADRNGAEALRGVELAVPRSALPPLEPGEYYHVDLISLPCVSDAGDEIGRVVAVENFGAGDILEIEKPDGKRFMVPIHAAEIEADRAVIESAFVE